MECNVTRCGTWIKVAFVNTYVFDGAPVDMMLMLLRVMRCDESGNAMRVIMKESKVLWEDYRMNRASICALIFQDGRRVGRISQLLCLRLWTLAWFKQPCFRKSRGECSRGDFVD